MTMEEAITQLQDAKDGYKEYLTDEALDMAIKALEILDKIKAEIEQIADEEQKYDEKWAIGLRYAVKIIDKYKEENEVEE